ncbi:MAG: cold-shock protein [Aquabacterium sp.]|nr:cold-shock protein [Aquabacterium sp.]
MKRFGHENNSTRGAALLSQHLGAYSPGSRVGISLQTPAYFSNQTSERPAKRPQIGSPYEKTHTFSNAFGALQHLTACAYRLKICAQIHRRGSMATGTVKWFNDAKGFGFIDPDQGEGDVFAHFSAIQMDGFRTLKQGSKVQYELVAGPKGMLAQNIQAIEGQPDAETAHDALSDLHFRDHSATSQNLPH